MAETTKKVPSGANRAVSSRWTPRLAKVGWTPISDFFLDNYHRLNPPIKHAEAMFVVHLMRHKWDTKAPYPGFKMVAKKMGISAEAVRMMARRLESKGYLFREMQVGATNRFHLDKLFLALEQLLVKDARQKAEANLKNVEESWRSVG
jgi:hypothetical protein